MGVPVSVAQGRNVGGGQAGPLGCWPVGPGPGERQGPSLDPGSWPGHTGPQGPAHGEVGPVASPGDRACSGQNGSCCRPSACASCQKTSWDPRHGPPGLPPAPVSPAPSAPRSSRSRGPGVLPQDPLPLFTLPEARPESRAPPPISAEPPGGDGHADHPGPTGDLADGQRGPQTVPTLRDTGWPPGKNPKNKSKPACHTREALRCSSDPGPRGATRRQGTLGGEHSPPPAQRRPTSCG